MAVLNSFLQVFIVLGRYNFVSISTTTWQGASDELSMILLYAFGKMYISSLSCKSTMYYWWIISSASVSPHSSIVVNFSVFPAILQGPPRQSGIFITSLLIRNILISIQIMAEITSEGLIFSTEIYEFLTRSQYSWDIGHTFVTYSNVYCCEKRSLKNNLTWGTL